MSESDIVCEDGVCRPRAEADDRIDPFRLMTPDLLKDLDLSRREGATETVQRKPSSAASETTDGPPEAVRKYLAGQGSRVAGGDADRKLPDPIKPDQTRPDQTRPDPTRPRPGKDILPPPRPGDDRVTPPKDTAEFKDHYEVAELDAALKLAAEKGLPVIARIGASWCPPCREMERNVWPQIEKDYKGKAIFVHIDADQVGENSSAAAQKLKMEGSGGYPTFGVFRAKQGPDGALDIETVEKRKPGGAQIHEARSFMTRVLNQWGPSR